MELEGLNSTEWWFLRTQIENVNINTEDHRMEDEVYVITISDNANKFFDLYMDTVNNTSGGILNPFKVVKL